MINIGGEGEEKSIVIYSLFICVVAPKQVDYMNEVKEFEAEMRKHSHKFPHDILSYHTTSYYWQKQALILVLTYVLCFMVRSFLDSFSHLPQSFRNSFKSTKVH